MRRPWILDYDGANCTIGAAVGIIGEKWTFLVLREVFNGVRRFDDMQRRTQAPRQVLSDRLARLVGQGLLRKVPYQEHGQRSRHEYRLTDKGLDLYPVLVALMQWGDRYAASPAGPQALLTHRGLRRAHRARARLCGRAHGRIRPRGDTAAGPGRAQDRLTG
jgi:DNA-binding HxlR family transcriptional regulator